MNQLILKPSVQGVGVFTLKSINIDMPMDLFASDDCKFLSHDEAQGLLYDQFCLQAPNGRACPMDFNRMSIGWYMNHADSPNLVLHNGHLFTARVIAGGEELTVNYFDLHRLFPEIKLEGRIY